MSVQSTRNQIYAFPPFIPNVPLPSVYERAGFDVNKEYYEKLNGSQASVRSGRSGRSGRSVPSSNRSRSSSNAHAVATPPNLSGPNPSGLVPKPIVLNTPVGQSLSRASNPSLKKGGLGEDQRPACNTAQNPNARSETFLQWPSNGGISSPLSGSTTSLPSLNHRVEPAGVTPQNRARDDSRPLRMPLPGSVEPLVPGRQRSDSINANARLQMPEPHSRSQPQTQLKHQQQQPTHPQSHLQAPLQPDLQNTSFRSQRTASVLPRALQGTPPPIASEKTAGEKLVNPRNISIRDHSFSSSGTGTDMSMVSSLSSESSDENTQDTDHHSSSATSQRSDDRNSWDSLVDSIPSISKGHLMVPEFQQHRDAHNPSHRLSSTSSIYSMSSPKATKTSPPPPAKPLVHGLGMTGVDFGTNLNTSTVAAAPPQFMTTKMRVSALNYQIAMGTPSLNVNKKTSPNMASVSPPKRSEYSSSQRSMNMTASDLSHSNSSSSSKMSASSHSGTKVCRGCSAAILKNGIRSKEGNLSGRWHRECFKCYQCKQNLDGSVYVLDDQPYCGGCFHATNSSCCRSCGLGIEGDCMETRDEAGGHTIRYHHDCLRCVDCQCLLTKSYFVVDGGNFCHEHAYGSNYSGAKVEQRFTRFAMI